MLPVTLAVRVYIKPKAMAAAAAGNNKISHFSNVSAGKQVGKRIAGKHAFHLTCVSNTFLAEKMHPDQRLPDNMGTIACKDVTRHQHS